MKFICPVCKTAGDIPDHEFNSGQPATQTACLKCGTGLSVEHATGQVQRRSVGQDLLENRAASHPRPKYAESSVLSMGLQDKGKNDYLAITVFAAVLCALIAIGVYFSLNIKQGAWDRPLHTISRLVDDAKRYGKNILGEFQKERQPRTRQAQRHVRKGYEHYKENRLEKALEELSLAIETHPENPEAYFWRARTFIRLEKDDNAIADLKTVVNLNPGYSPAYDNLGWLFMRRNDYDESLASLNKSIELKPDNGWAHYMRGRVYFKRGDIQKAVENAKTACDLGYKDGCGDVKRYESDKPK
jgi:tetratricopeptide (TPR) repeat protein